MAFDHIIPSYRIMSDDFSEAHCKPQMRNKYRNIGDKACILLIK